ncbi:glycine zipper 2TM domain-containing protein [Arcobacter sp. LA11]|uniref:glycine zipper 2TM domain-containing protein n=1 Tax=Arcobacter sp. LA11 TaxID=1898176 RepID=UPI000933119F|nr:glycine zipper 2TM domain-containing protein [Arcobacter sp. LA11]
MKKIFLVGLLLVSSSFAGSDRFYDYAKVRYSEPIYEYKYNRQPKRECKEVRYKINDNYDDRYYSSNNYNDELGVDTLIGTAAGAVLGSQIGKGNGRVAAQIVGGLLGAKVAHEIRNNYKPRYNNRYNDRYDDDYRYETRTECYDVSHKRVKRKIITGYKNYFVYNGEEHYKITNRPKRKIKITHTISF